MAVLTRCDLTISALSSSQSFRGGRCSTWPTQRRRIQLQAGRGPVASAGTVSETPPAASMPQKAQPAPFKIPKSLSEVDNGKILGFGAELAEGHPGFADEAYKQRRVDICKIASKHEIGAPIPAIEYTAEETAVWSYVMNELAELFPAHACSEFLASWRELGFSPRRVPQLQEVSEFLRARSGWQIRPVAGLLHPRDFLNGLAFRTFHSTQYMRHGADPCWTPEPDIVHEMIGHVPMLAHPAFCQLAHAIGVASLGADEAQIWHLTKCYWYTVEFGVVREGGGVKAFGAGVLSSYGEMKNMASGRAGLREFDPFQKQPKMSYSDGYQKTYTVLDSFEDGAAKLEAYCKTLHVPLSDEVRQAVGLA
ncbi:AAH1 [Auxenochlorella protothecoides x Auxenochlorella symbiontica]